MLRNSQCLSVLLRPSRRKYSPIILLNIFGQPLSLCSWLLFSHTEEGFFRNWKMWKPPKLFHYALQRGTVEFQQGQFVVVSYHGVQNVPVNIINDSIGLLKWRRSIYAIKDCHWHNGVLWNTTVWHSETRSTVSPHTTNDGRLLVLSLNLDWTVVDTVVSTGIWKSFLTYKLPDDSIV